MKRLIFLLVLLPFVLFSQPAKSVLTQKQITFIDSMITAYGDTGDFVDKSSTQTITGQKNFSGGIISPETDSLFTKTSHIVTPEMFGAVGDGVTDDSTAFDNMFQYLYDNGGGEVQLSAKTYLDGSRWDIPHSDTVGLVSQYYNNVPIKIVGSGNYAQSTGIAAAPTSGTILKFAYNGSSDYFITTYGTGTLSFEGITFLTDVANKAFLKIIATTTYIKNCTFYGAGAGTSASNDCILLGGGTYVDNFLTDSSAFQGYGTVIKDNYFSRVRRIIYGLTYCNGVQIKDNTIWNTCGTNIDSVAAFDFYGDGAGGSNVCTGNIISGNLIEANHYWYAVRGYRNFLYNIITDNTIYDVTGSTTFKAVIRLQNNSGYNYITLTNFSDLFGVVSEDASSLNKNTLISTLQEIPSKFSEPINTYNKLNSYNASPMAFYHSDTYRYWNYFLSASGGYYNFNYQFTDSAATYTPLLMSYYPNTLTTLQLGKQGYITTSDGDLRLRPNGANTLWLGQDNKIYINAGIFYSILSTGTAPFSITSTTPVDNLTVKRISTPTFIGDVATDISMGLNELLEIGNINYAGAQDDTTGLNAKDFYYDPLTHDVKIAIGATVVSNGDFFDWTGDNPNNWSLNNSEDAGNYVTESPTGVCSLAVDGNIGAWAIVQSSLTLGIEYGYSFDVLAITDTMLVFIGGENINITHTGTYTGIRTATSVQINVKENFGASSIQIDNLRIWETTGGEKEVPTYDVPVILDSLGREISGGDTSLYTLAYIDKVVKNSTISIFDFTDPVITDTFLVFWADDSLQVDSIRCYADDSTTINIWLEGLNMLNAPYLIDDGVTSTITSIANDVIYYDEEALLYFSALGDNVKKVHLKIYWRYL